MNVDVQTPPTRTLLLEADPATVAEALGRVVQPGIERINATPENVEKGLSQLVLTLIELLRQLMERQALRRMEAGSLNDEEIERLGLTLMRLEERMEELRTTFGLTKEDLNINLGPLGNLL